MDIVDKILVYFLCIAIFVVVPIVSIVFLIAISKKYQSIEKVEKIKKFDKNNYVREIPNKENTAVGVASLLYKLKKISYRDMGNTLFRIIQATILEFEIKGYVDIYENEKKETILKWIEKDKRELTSTQYVIMDFIKKISENKEEIEIKEMKKRIRENKELYKKTFGTKFVIQAAKEQKELRNYNVDTQKEKELKKCCIDCLKNLCIIGLQIIFWFGLALGHLMISYIILTVLLTAFLYGILLFVEIFKNTYYRIKIFYYIVPGSRGTYITYEIIQAMTNKGIKEREEWRAFERYLREYTLIKEYERESLIVNKEYLVYATLFGIADEVQNDLGKYKPLIIFNY